MSNIIPLDKAQLPERLRKSTLRHVNDEALGGIKLGGFKRIALKGTRFVLKDGEEERVVDRLELPLVIVRANKNLNKTWYATKYNPNQEEGKSPDCFSMDGIAPDPSSPQRQNDRCATCKWNQFGTSVDQNGRPGKGKACADTKQLATFTAVGGEGDLYGLKVPPASLKNYGKYVHELNKRGIPVAEVLTVLGFDPNQSYPVLSFKFGGFLNDAQAEKIAELATSPDAEEIIHAKPPVEPKAEESTPEADDMGFSAADTRSKAPQAALTDVFGAEDEAEDEVVRDLADPQPQPKPEPKKAKKQDPVAEVTEDDAEEELASMFKQAEPKPKKQEKPKKATKPEPVYVAPKAPDFDPAPAVVETEENTEEENEELRALLGI